MAVIEQYVDVVQKAYIAYFGRPADPVGLDTWTNKVAEAGGSVEAMIAGFGNSAESQMLYGGSTAAEIVNNIYLQLFNRAAEPAGLLHWSTKIESGEITAAEAAFTIMSNAQNNDALRVANKLAVAKEFTDSLDTSEEILEYAGQDAADIAREMLSQVEYNTDTGSFDVQSYIDEIANDAPVAANDTNSGDEDTVITGDVSTNDTDDGALTYSLDAPVFGLTLNADGTYSFNAGHPAYQGLQDGQSTQVVANYTVTDEFGVTDTATLTITVNGTNEAPVAKDASAEAVEGGAVVVGAVSATDSDTSSSNLTYSLLSATPAGLTFNANGGYSFNPAVAAYDSLDEGDIQVISLTYQVSDGDLTDTGVLQITLTGTNDAPVASAATTSTNEDNAISVAVTATDKDADDTLTYEVNTLPSHGTVSNVGGIFTYTPDENYNGPDGFTYKVTDTDGAVSVNTISITVKPVNDNPVAEDDAAEALEGGAVVVGELSASDVDSASLVFSVVGTPPAGFTLNANGKFTFDPSVAAYNSLSAGEEQELTITYQVSDSASPVAGTDTGVLTITVTGTNDSPLAKAAVATVAEDGEVDIDVVATDVDNGDALQFQFDVNTQPSHGTVTSSGNTFTYTPDDDYTGQDSFTYVVDDGNGGTSVASVTVTVSPVNDAPVAQDDAAEALEGGAVVAGSLTATDIDSASLVFSLVTAAPAGFTLNANGNFTFDPTVAAYNGLALDEELEVVIPYSVSDGSLSDEATLTITVTGTNDAPVATAASADGDEDTVINLTVPAATDVDGDDLEYFVETQPSNGTVTADGDGGFSYTPNANFNGSDSFTYRVEDGNGGVSIATVSLTVDPVNDAPSASDADASGFEDTVIEGSVSASDIDGDDLTYDVVTGPAHGSVVLNDDGTFVYTPDENYAGSDEFTYKVNDGTEDSNIATVTLSVTDINEVLTPGQDTIVSGGSTDDLIYGSNNNLNAGDSVDGGDDSGASVDDVKKHAAPDRDILVHSLDSDLGDRSFEGFTLNDVETLEVNNDAQSDEAVTYDLSNSEGLETIRNINSTADTEFHYANMNDGSNFVNLEVLNLTTGRDTSLDLRNDAVTGNEDEVNLLVTDSDDDSEDAGAINIMQLGKDLNGWDTDASGSSDADSGIETVNLRTYSGDVTDDEGILRDSDNEVRINDLNTVGTRNLNILTAQDLVIGDTDDSLGSFQSMDFENALSASLNNIDASGATGDIAFSTSDDVSGTTNIALGTGDDFIKTGTANDIVDLGDGDDAINSNGGADSVNAGEGDDSVDLTSGSGDDTVYGGEGADTILTGNNDDDIYGGADNDGINAGNGHNYVEGNGGDDSITVGTGNDVVHGGSDDDYIDISAGGSDYVTGGEGSDTVFAGSSLTSGWTEPGGANGGDTLDGGPGYDVLIINDSNADGNILDRVTGFEKIIIQDSNGGGITITVTDESPFDNDTTSESPVIIDATALDAGEPLVFEGNDTSPDIWGNNVLDKPITVLGGAGNDSIVTGNGADSVDGNSGNDTIETGALDDTVEMGTGDDSVQLGSGEDLLIVQDAEFDTASSDSVHGGAGADTVQLDNPNGYYDNLDVNITLGVNMSGIETLFINDLDDGPDGNDNDIEVLFDAGYNQSTITIDGSELDAGESLNVDAKANAASAANDASGLEAIHVIGGEGADSVDFGHSLDAQDSYDGNGGTDSVKTDGQKGDVAFTGLESVEILNLTTDGADDDDVTLSTEAEEAGISTVNGSADNDTVDASGYQDEITIFGNNGDDSLVGGSGDDSIVGGMGDDTIRGNAGNDTLDGGESDDMIFGGAGDDSILQGSGTDYVEGNGDDDTFVVKGSQMDYDDTVLGGAGSDTMELNNNEGGANDDENPVDADIDLDNVRDVEFFVTKDRDHDDPLGGINNVTPANFDIEFKDGNVTTQTLLTIDARSLTDHDGDNITVTIHESVDKDYAFDVYGGDHNDRLNDLATSKPNDIEFWAGDGDDTLNVDGTDLGTTVSMHGGSGIDVIEVTGGALTDESFVDVNGIEHIKAASPATALFAELGEKADMAFSDSELDLGIGSITGGAGDDAVELNSLFDTDLNIDLSAGGDDSVDASQSSSTITVQGEASDFDGNDTLKGGTGDADTYEITADNGTSDLTTNQTGFERIKVLEGEGTDDENVTIIVNDNFFTDNQAGNVVTVDASGLDDFDTYAPDGNSGDPEGSFIFDGSAVADSDNAFDITGGTGADSILTGAGADTIYGGDDNNVDGSPVNYSGVLNHDFINSGAGNDLVTTGNGDDTIETEDGDDTISGGAGDDLVKAGAGDDSVSASPGDDTIFGASGNDTLESTTGEDWLYGGSDDDSISAGSGDDQIAGDDDGEAGGWDTIDAGEGADVVYGGEKGDTIYLGQNDGDSDTLIYTKRTDSTGSINSSPATVDTVYEFEGNVGAGGDKIDIRYLAFDPTLIALALDGKEVRFAGNGTDQLEAQALLTSDIVADPDLIGAVFDQDKQTVWFDINDDGELSGDDLRIKLAGVEALDAYNVMEGQKFGWLENENGSIVDDHILITNGGTYYGLGGDDVMVIGNTGNGGTAIGGDGADSLVGSSDGDTLIGGSGNDTIDGSDGADSIEGNHGDDTILGGDGNDTILGGSGNDTIDGGSGADSILGQDGDDSVNGADGNDTIIATPGEDTIHGDAGDDSLVGGEENDTITGGTGNDIIDGGTGSDDINGGEGADTIYGGDQEDMILGSDGDDSILGEGGDDTIDGGSGNDTVLGGSDDDLIEGGSGNDDLQGQGGSDDIFGEDGSDDIDGGEGDDSLVGGEGADSIYGGSDDDTIQGNNGEDFLKGEDGSDDIEGGASDDVIDGGAGDDDLSGGEGNDTIDGSLGDDLVEGGNGDDDLYGDYGNFYSYDSAGSVNLPNSYSNQGGGDDTLLGGSGDDLIAGDGNGYSETSDGDDLIDGGSGNDTIYGEGGSDDIDGGEGADSILAGTGDDNVDGDDGADTIMGNAGADTLKGDAGDDYINGGSDDDVIDGGVDDDSLMGNDGADYIFGNDGSDDIQGNDGADTIDGGMGDDSIFGNASDDVIDGGEGNDTIDGGTGSDAIQGGSGSDDIYGQDGNDTIDGEDGDDTIRGDSGSDDIDGGSGNDTIFDNDGSDEGYFNDSIDGGAGNDWIWVVGGADTVNGGAGNDTIDAWGFGGDNSDDAQGDVLNGNDGSDDIEGGNGADTIDGGSGNDTIRGDAGSDDIEGGSGDDTIFDNDGSDEGYFNDMIDGEDGEDFIWSVGGSDTIYGGSDDDTIRTDGFGGANSDDGAGDFIFGEDGSDDITAGWGDDSIDGGSGNDTIDGGNGSDDIDGGEGADSIDGGNGSDDIVGDIGDDTIRAGDGSDSVDAGQGDDDIYLGSDDDADYLTFGPVATNGSDEVYDFDGEFDDDRLFLHNEDDQTFTNDSIVTVEWNEEGDGAGAQSIAGASLVVFEGSDTDTIDTAAEVETLLDNQDGTFNGGVYVITRDGDDGYLWYDSDANDDNGGSDVTLIGVFHGNGDNLADDFLQHVEFYDLPL